MGLGLEKCCSPHIKYQDERQFSRISESYLGYINDYSNVSHQVPNYFNITHCCLVNKLMKFNRKFYDQLYPVSILSDNDTSKRISELYPYAQFAAKNFEINFQDIKLQSSLSSKKFIDAMYRLKNYPQLINRIFPNKKLGEVGFYALYFCINGRVNQGERREIIIDDFVPINRFGEYEGSRVSKESGIWTILIEKALAKCVGSFRSIDYLTEDQIFSEITGVPIPKLYQRNHQLKSSLYQFCPDESKYIRISISQPTKLLLAIWQSCQEITGLLTTENFFKKEEDYPEKLIVDLIDEVDNDTLNSSLQHLRIKNRHVLLSPQSRMLDLKRGRYILHIFNRSKEKVSCNLVIQSDMEIAAPIAIFGLINEQKKARMIKNMYQRVHSERPVLYQYPGLALRIAWLGCRAILCLKNQSQHSKTIILELINDNVILEENPKIRRIEKILKMNCHEIFILVIRLDKGILQHYGHFYKIHLL